jgi:hypothetical protein
VSLEARAKPGFGASVKAGEGFNAMGYWVGREVPLVINVPKLSLGHNCVPKCNLGTRKPKCSIAALGSVGTRNFSLRLHRRDASATKGIFRA